MRAGNETVSVLHETSHHQTPCSASEPANLLGSPKPNSQSPVFPHCSLSCSGSLTSRLRFNRSIDSPRPVIIPSQPPAVLESPAQKAILLSERANLLGSPKPNSQSSVSPTALCRAQDSLTSQLRCNKSIDSPRPVIIPSQSSAVLESPAQKAILLGEEHQVKHRSSYGQT
ncbi:hypothetical protein CDD83_8553 [Cordyceps sp. RAO-2017]|nr:hypothetical protein CDD83_8553 [Cordyceps sp. RAO-2017]